MKKNKYLLGFLLVTIIGIVGLTFAYFINSISIENNFKTKEYGTTFTEEFESPDNWLPGDTTNKSIAATNTGKVDQAVRISLTESWTTHNNGTLNGWIHPDGTKSNHTTDSELASDERVAILNLANTNDWTKVTEDGIDYYYYNYKLAPNESTSSFIESVTFNSKMKLDDMCTTTTVDGETTVTCSSSGNGYDNATYTLTINIETIQYNKYATAWETSMTIASEKPKNATQVLVENATNPAGTEYNNETKEKMFTFSHTLNGNTVNETRYIGDSPKNYVKFNCDDDGSNCEIWRILGVFSVDDGTGNVEERIKLVRGSKFENNMVFNSNINNDWTVSLLNTFLNGDYYNRSGDAATFGLKASAQNMIGNAEYYLGAVTGSGNTEAIYGEERGNLVCGACNSDTTKLKWTGKIGLMYPSDQYMVYGNGVNIACYDKPNTCWGTDAQTGWVHKSNNVEENTVFLSSRAGNSRDVRVSSSIGSLGDYYSYGSYNIRPVVYLKSNVKIFNGTGDIDNPYTFYY